jgi:integrase
MPRGVRRYDRITSEEFASVIKAFLASTKFQNLALSTRTNYRHLLLLAEHKDSLGSIPVEEMRPALIQAFLDGLADRPATQKNAQTAMKSLERWAIVRDLLPRPITTGTEAPGGTGGHIPWTDEQVALGELHARPHLAKVISLAANTGQRGSDLVKMRWTDIEEVEGRPGINVRQMKTGLEIWVPFTGLLMAAMSRWERRPGFILLKEDGHPFTREQLSDQWLRERDTRAALAPLRDAGVRLHGLRGTAVVRLRRAGATTPQISDMVGMSPLMVKRYSRYSDQRENALAAVHVLDRTAGERLRSKKSSDGGVTS